MSGDYIEKLPVDDSKPSADQMNLVNNIFKENYSTMDKLASEFREGIVIAILFIVFSLPQVDGVIQKFVPSADNTMILTGIKAVIVVLLFYFIKNFHLSKRN